MATSHWRSISRTSPAALRASTAIQFFTQQKVTTARWFSFGEGDVWQR